MRPLPAVIRDRHVLLGLRHAAAHVRLRLVLAHQLPEAVHFREDHLAHLGDVFDDFEGEVKCRGAWGLVRGVVPDVEIAMLERFFDGDPGGGIESEHAVEEIQRVRVGAGEELLEGALGHGGKVADVVLRTGRTDAGEGLFVRSAEDVEDLVELVDIVAAFEKGAPAKQFSKDTAN